MNWNDLGDHFSKLSVNFMKFSTELEKLVCFRNTEGVNQQRKMRDPENKTCNTGVVKRSPKDCPCSLHPGSN